ncbi:DedA family protein [Pseudonocardia sp. MH-G8]|uniref:DedA family protein n=1 Tax=Pseudonocardia sp. MH-G8 TaxID=1854588 RepID=UPI001179F0CA|nr:VTT domain-containing protein [Pseudonocardia sp. MH-G8]
MAEHPMRAVLLVVVGALLEGPIVTVAAAALAGGGVLTWWSVWLAAACADVLADTLLYALGRHGERAGVRRMLVRLGLTDERRDTLTTQVHAHLPRVVIAAKLVDLGAVPAFLAAGLARVDVRRFLSWVVPATVVRSGVLVGIGFLAGDRFSEDLSARPWLLAVGGLAVGILLVLGRAMITRLVPASRDRGVGPFEPGNPTIEVLHSPPHRGARNGEPRETTCRPSSVGRATTASTG